LLEICAESRVILSRGVAGERGMPVAKALEFEPQLRIH